MIIKKYLVLMLCAALAVILSGCSATSRQWQRSPYYKPERSPYNGSSSRSIIKSPWRSSKENAEGKVAARAEKDESRQADVEDTGDRSTEKNGLFSIFKRKSDEKEVEEATKVKDEPVEVAEEKPAAKRMSFFDAFKRRPGNARVERDDDEPELKKTSEEQASRPVTTAASKPAERSQPAVRSSVQDGKMVEVESFVATSKTQVVSLRPGLMLNVSVLVAGKKEIEEKMRRISDNGLLELPLLGALTVKDMPSSELSGYLAKLYKEYYVDPQVIIDFAQDEKGNDSGVSPWGFVTVLGRVKTPGRIPIPPTQDMTVSGSIQKAGGFDTSANVKGIKVTRRSSDGKTETREVDLHAVGSKGKLKEDIVLRAEDVVYVPEQMF